MQVKKTKAMKNVQKLAVVLNTMQHKKLTSHLHFAGGSKTVCVSTCLHFFGIAPEAYNYTSSKSNIHAYKNVLRRFGYSVRSRNTEFKIKKARTLSGLKLEIKKSNYSAKDYFIVHCVKASSAHLIVVDGTGTVKIDTAPNSRWNVKGVSIVEKQVN